MSIKPSIVWFRRDLRLEDQPALMAAMRKGGPVIPLFIWAPEEEGEWAPGAASRWWLHYSLASLQKELSSLGLSLVIRQHLSLQVILDLIKQTGADSVFWTRRYEPLIVQRDASIKAELQKQGIKAMSFNGSLLFEPWTVANKQSHPFQVFTPFWKKCLSLGEPEPPLERPCAALAYAEKIDSDSLEDLSLLPKIRWDAGLEEMWCPGSKGARAHLVNGLEHIIGHYMDMRDRPDLKGTTELSPYLHFGEISPRVIWQGVRQKFGYEHPGAQAYLRQLGWREFAYHLLYHFPRTPSFPLKEAFMSFAWNRPGPALKAWQKGQTGYPIIDAGMRQLWKTGWMHNRVRMIAASFLVKDLLIPWQEGAAWFWNTLVDADLANNTLGWQWVAGCGADAAPYFRIFNPVSQGEKFDPLGHYVRKWVPELQWLPDKWIHQPWAAPDEIIRRAGVQLGIDYPNPIVDHAQAREKALEAYAKL
ncbi:cryptochrome/photolyase family protein [Candidatus Protochlamydia phocaeensis]|uniref:cryptochrome/photolyase family protein n=1 Tax=Candidatus Protochlamydia phocaeensis TaxID=1414722 RepID=UPI000838A07C|nr:deoxyribodipyrimidine photo-lyase [Candidatus Protochlamydia phocaeensis]